MIEDIISIKPQNIVDICGVNNENIALLGRLFPQVKLVARGNDIKIMGSQTQITAIKNLFEILLQWYEKYGTLTESDIIRLLEKGEEFMAVAQNESQGGDIILRGKDGQNIRARTVNQIKIVQSIQKNDMVFAIGPAGTGKTYTAVALAVRALRNKEIKRIILTRPAVEAGENLGFLPGDVQDKLDPYLQPLYDALRDMIPPQKLLSLVEDKTIEIAPLAFMRGRTLDNAYVILDEAQNATAMQLKMFLTRMGRNAKFLITGDLTQIDLPKHQTSGLPMCIKLLQAIKGIDIITLDKSDVVRHPLVAAIIQAYEKQELHNNE
ncbi:MAG: PhoH family protein [Bacteroidales bacterium]|nr:PhoH family protein [Bacteroidales bacterium]